MNSIASKFGATLFLLAFFAGGMFFFVVMARTAHEQWQREHWPTIPCTVTSSSAETSENGYELVVRYRYEVAGKSHVGRVYRSGYSGSDNYNDAQKLVSRYPPGLHTTCSVNPADPNDAVLVTHLGYWWMLFGLIPLVFVVIGGAGAFFVWFPRTKKSKPISDSSTISPRKARATGILFFGIFFVVGLLITVLWTIPTIHKTVASRHWPATTCTVLSSRVQSHEDSDNHGTTYSIDVLYSYKINGKEYRSTKYDFVGGSSSGYDSKLKVVKQYRPHHPATCYVNPNDPSEAILHPGVGWSILLPLIPTIFLLVGAGGIVGTLYPRKPKIRPANASSSPTPNPTRTVQFKSPLATFIFLLLFSILWNAIVGYAVYNSDFQDAFDLCHAAFLAPFVLVGLVMIVLTGGTFLQIFNPTLQLNVDATILRLGEQGRVSWNMKGRVDRLTKLVIRIEGSERATYRRGTSTNTDTSVFTIINVAEITSPTKMAQGEATFQIPSDTMHTFDSGHNSIRWEIKARGEIPNWPDVTTDVTLVVEPQDVQIEEART